MRMSPRNKYCQQCAVELGTDSSLCRSCWRKRNSPEKVVIERTLTGEKVTSGYFGGLRDEILLRDKHTCRLCGITEEQHKSLYKAGLHVDHIEDSGLSQSYNGLFNLITLCGACHREKHSTLRKYPHRAELMYYQLRKLATMPL